MKDYSQSISPEMTQTCHPKRQYRTRHCRRSMAGSAAPRRHVEGSDAAPEEEPEVQRQQMLKIWAKEEKIQSLLQQYS